MEEKILSILLDMQIDIKEMKKEQQEMKKEQAEMKKEQQGMKKEIQGIKKEQQGMKEDIQEIKKEQQGMKEEIRINKINIAKILEVQNQTVELLKEHLKKNDEEHKQFDQRIYYLETKKVI